MVTNLWYADDISAHREHKRRTARTRKPSSQYNNRISWNATQCQENGNDGCHRRQVPNHSESRLRNAIRGALFQIPQCKVQRGSDVCRGSKNK